MITTGIIKSNRVNDSGTMLYTVELPIFKNAGVSSDLNKATMEATCSVDSGTYNPYDIGDLVYVSFVNNEKGSPVILGKIYKYLPNGKEDARTFQYIKTLEVIENATLPENTKLGDVELKQFLNMLNDYNSIADIIDILKNVKNDKYLHTNATTGALEWVSGGGEPNAYLKSASVSGGTLTLTNKDDTTVVYTPITFNAMKTSWRGSSTSLTTLQSAQLMLADSDVVDGQAYQSTVYWTDLPAGMSAVEVRAYVINKSNGIVLFEANSADTSPYNWTYNSHSSGRSWIGSGGNTVIINPTGTPTDVAETINVDGTIYDLDTTYTNENGTTIKVGGIEVGTTFADKKLSEIIEAMLYPYVAFTFSSITTNPSSGTFEYGTSKTITQVKPTFAKGSKNISSVKIGCSSGGSELYSGSSATSGSWITLSTSKVLDGKTSTTIYCQLGDGTTTLTKYTPFTFSKYNYYTVNQSTTPPTSGTAIGTGNQKDITIGTDNSYIWFMCPSSKTKIQQYAMSQWNDITTTAGGTVTFTTNTGQQLTYYTYRTPLLLASTGTYKIV